MFYTNPSPQLYTRTYSLAQVYKLADEKFDFRSNPDLICIDLGKSIKVYEWHFNNTQYIEWNHYKYLQTKLLLFGANYYGVYPFDAIKDGMYELAKSIAKRCVGIGINELSIDYNVDLAMRNIENYEFEPNKSIRYINNPFYVGEPININQELGKEKKELNSSLIQDYLEDYDYNQGKITYKKIGQDLNISERTIKRYLKDGCLRELYDIVKANSKR